MTSDSDRDARLDSVIDEVARAMTHAASPDLRAGVGERLDRPAPGLRRWQPALAAATLAIALAWWNGVREPAPVVSGPPATAIPAAPAISQAQAARPVSPAPLMPAATRSVRTLPARRSMPLARPAEPWPVPNPREAGLNPVAPDPLDVEPLSHSAPEFVPMQIPAIAVSAIVIEPLPRSMP